MQSAIRKSDALFEQLDDDRQRVALAYWLSKCPPEGLPGRQDIDPAEITALLPWINLVDVVREGPRLRYRHRLEGTALVTRFGRESTGRWFEDNYTRTHLKAQIGAYDAAVVTATPNFGRVAMDVPGRAPLAYSRLIMPLARDRRTVDMLFLLFAFHSISGSVPVSGLPMHCQA